MPAPTGSSALTLRTQAAASNRIGRLAATTMMANTNMGSVKSRESMYAVADSRPLKASIATRSTMAQNPNTTSTSPSR